MKRSISYLLTLLAMLLHVAFFIYSGGWDDDTTTPVATSGARVVANDAITQNP